MAKTGVRASARVWLLVWHLVPCVVVMCLDVSAIVTVLPLLRAGG